MVEDEGPGLPQDAERTAGHIRSHSGSDRKGGAGLGLAIVKAFAEAMGGKVARLEPGGRRARSSHSSFPRLWS